jgi:hypothetical protein
MKNIHLLPTDKPSRLYINLLDYLSFDSLQLRGSNQNIYITSDEKSKEGDWCIVTPFGADKFAKVVRFKKENGTLYNLECKKIILTTDQDLIKDGVQSIPDDFLEWFVKNPSCEEVEVEIESKFDRVDGHYHDVWEIIIPSKDDLKIGDNTNFGIITDINEKSVCFGKNKVGVDVWYKKSYVVKFPNLVLEEPKQETLEEAKIKHIKFCIENNIENPSFSFDKGVKWEQEQNEILLNEYHEYTVDCIEVDLKRPLPFKSWFKENKKK